MNDAVGLCAERTFGDKLGGRRVLHMIDNTVALSAFVHGCAKKLDMAKMSNLYWLYAASLQCDIYLDWVPSDANISDIPSRPRATWDAATRQVWGRFCEGQPRPRAMRFPGAEWGDARLLLRQQPPGPAVMRGLE